MVAESDCYLGECISGFSQFPGIWGRSDEFVFLRIELAGTLSSEKAFGTGIFLLHRGFPFWSAARVPADFVADPLFRSL